MSEEKVMTVGKLKKHLSEYPDDMLVKVYATEYDEFSIPEYSYNECDCDIYSVEKASERTNPESYFVRIELRNQRL